MSDWISFFLLITEFIECVFNRDHGLKIVSMLLIRILVSGSCITLVIFISNLIRVVTDFLILLEIFRIRAEMHIVLQM